jgi:integral membrane protein
VLLLVYALFTVAAGARSVVQLATDAGRAPVAYLLSLLAAVTYALGWVAIRRASEGRTTFASRMLWVELAGVITVGTLSLLVPDWFPDASVWSDYGIGYGFVPAALPVAGLLWLRAQDPSRSGSAAVTAFRVVAFAEALSWLGLLTGMFFKYVVDAGEQGVHVFGPIHGTVFLSYLVVTLLTWRHQRWSLPVALVALAASVPPFCTVLFEQWAERTGRLRPRA